ncbi:hypothetical protein [Bogoriella caseilytica]|uniref:Uncharacterized protein n=1 Tax=Bogoriella caseilytica TaxID=56055 RepID=A0A3N2BGT5_9MICO|nr:hypothetical protein [Bogoriella caseilytica]ROR74430.1 hypothetical protein EDD31_2846 [Bogoriella caseilytica]
MTISIYAYRSLIWLARNPRSGNPPETVCPPEDQKLVLREMAERRWTLPVEEVETLAGTVSFLLLDEGKAQARREDSDYLVRSAAYEVLQAVPTRRGADLLEAAAAFEDGATDPVTGEPFDSEIADDAAHLLDEHGLVDGVRSSNEAVFRMQLTPKGRQWRRAHWVPRIEEEAGQVTMNQHNAFNMNGGTLGAAVVGGQGNVANVQQDLDGGFAQALEELREQVRENAETDQDRDELLGQVDQLEEAAHTGDPGRMERLRNSFLEGFANKAGTAAASSVLGLPVHLVGAG